VTDGREREEEGGGRVNRGSEGEGEGRARETEDGQRIGGRAGRKGQGDGGKKEGNVGRVGDSRKIERRRIEGRQRKSRRFKWEHRRSQETTRSGNGSESEKKGRRMGERLEETLNNQTHM
jgi:hypothetical protein